MLLSTPCYTQVYKYVAVTQSAQGTTGEGSVHVFEQLYIFRAMYQLIIVCTHIIQALNALAY